MASYNDLKTSVYVALVLFGVCLLVIARYVAMSAPFTSDPVFYGSPAVILVLIGMTCIFFGIETFILRDDPEIWE